jgi:hypothetical protein
MPESKGQNLKCVPNHGLFKNPILSQPGVPASHLAGALELGEGTPRIPCVATSWSYGPSNPIFGPLGSQHGARDTLKSTWLLSDRVAPNPTVSNLILSDFHIFHFFKT